MSTIDVVEETSIFQSFQTSIPTDSTNPIAYDSQEIVWLVVFLASSVYFVYTFLKRKP